MKHIITSLLALLIAINCMAWGQKGHDTTCAIAQQHLTRKAKKRIEALLEGRSMLYWSNWLDNAVHTPEYEYAASWHYKNIDRGQAYADVPPFRKGDVVTALQELTARMKEYERRKSLTPEERADEALTLKMLVHLMGDLHQPLHLGHASDYGGNTVKVKYFGLDMNLHSVWDTNLVESAHAWSHTEWVEEIDRATPAERAAITAGTLDEWAEETFHIATRVYDETPDGTDISYNYVAQWTPIIEQQFLRGGLRLAKVLNECFR